VADGERGRAGRGGAEVRLGGRVEALLAIPNEAVEVLAPGVDLPVLTDRRNNALDELFAGVDAVAVGEVDRQAGRVFVVPGRALLGRTCRRVSIGPGRGAEPRLPVGEEVVVKGAGEALVVAEDLFDVELVRLERARRVTMQVLDPLGQRFLLGLGGRRGGLGRDIGGLRGRLREGRAHERLRDPPGLADAGDEGVPFGLPEDGADAREGFEPGVDFGEVGGRGVEIRRDDPPREGEAGGGELFVGLGLLLGGGDARLEGDDGLVALFKRDHFAPPFEVETRADETFRASAPAGQSWRPLDAQSVKSSTAVASSSP
jgi:hypothetical protein